MNEYERKQEEKKQRFLDRAAKAERQSNSAYKSSRRISDFIPFGQPILVGHHSEKRHRRDLGRIDSLMRKSFEEGEKAKYYEQRAASVGTGGISSDDPDAIVKLKEKVAKLEGQQEKMKAANKAIRKGDDEALRALGFSDEQIARLKSPDFLNRVGFPDYAISNNSANIRRIKQRIEVLEMEFKKAQEEGDGARKEYDGFAVFEEDNRLQFEFPGKPSDEIRSTLKSNGFKWSPSRGTWVRFLNSSGRWAAERVVKILAKGGADGDTGKGA